MENHEKIAWGRKAKERKKLRLTHRQIAMLQNETK